MSDISVDPEFEKWLMPLTSDEYAGLEESLQKEGCRNPIVVWDNIIIDGHHRFKICKKFGIPFNIISMQFSTNDEARDWIIKNQLARRNTTSEQRAYLIGRLYNENKSSRGGNNSNRQNVSLALSKQFNVDERTVLRDSKFANAIDKISSQCGDYAKNLILTQNLVMTRRNVLDIAALDKESQLQIIDEAKQLKDVSLNKIINKVKKSSVLKKERNIILNRGDNLNPNIRLYCGDLRTLSDDIQDESVEMVFCDPPYGAKYISLYEDIGKISSRILKPSGFCVVYAGTLHLIEHAKSLEKNLLYYHTTASIHSSSHLIRKVNILNEWRPILIFQKPPFKPTVFQTKDVVTSPREKELHDWQQSLVEAEILIKNFSREGDTIADFCMGSGTIPLAAFNTGRKAIGFEINEDTFNLAKARCASPSSIGDLDIPPPRRIKV